MIDDAESVMLPAGYVIDPTPYARTLVGLSGWRTSGPIQPDQTMGEAGFEPA